MADSKISALPAAGALAGSELTPVIQGGVTVKTTVNSIANTVSNAVVIGKVLTGYVSGAGVVAATDTILQAIQKLNGNISLVTGAVVYQGTWNANTNTPTLTSGVGTKGYMYKVSVAGTTTIDGVSQWNVGDQIVFNGTTWDKIDGIPNEVLSVNGQVGAVTLTLNGLTGITQTFATGTSGTDFGIVSSGTVHTFNIPDASATARGLVTTGTQTFAGAKTFANDTTFSGNIIYTPTVNSSLSGSNARIPSHTTSNLIFTNVGLTSIGSANNGGVVGGHTLSISNNTGASIVIVNNYGSAAAGEAIYTGRNADITLPDKTTLYLQYNATASAWECIVGGLVPMSAVTGVLLPANGGTGISNNNASTWTISGNFGTTVTVTGTTSVTLPTSGTLYGTATGSITSAQLATSISDETGSGALVFGTSPTFTTNINTPQITGVSSNLVFTNSTVSTGAPIQFQFTTVANTGQTASANIPNFKVTGSTKTWAAGTLATQYFNYFSANTVAFASASTATDVYNLYTEAPLAGTNTTITNAWALGTNGNVSFYHPSTSRQTIFAPYVGSGFINAIYMLGSASGATSVAPSATNWMIAGDGSNTLINAPSGYIAFSVGTAKTSGATQTFNFNVGANTGQTLSTEIPGFLYATGSRQWATGNITIQREFYIKSITYSFVAASTITNSYGLYVEAATAGTNATITNNWALGLKGGLTIENSGKLQLGNAATTGLSAGVLAGQTNASIVLYDSTGQAYRIPCII